MQNNLEGKRIRNHMGTQERRVKIYKITNNSTDDTYVGSTTSALYKRLYRHKHDADTGAQSKLCSLMRALGKDKFKIEMVEEGAFSRADAVNARVAFWIRSLECALNDEDAEAKPEDRLTREMGTQTDHEDTPTESSSASVPESYYMSDEEQEAEEVPENLPSHDLTGTMFEALRGYMDDLDNQIVKGRFDRIVLLGKHVCKYPRGLEAREQWLSSKATFARQAAITRRDAPKSGLDQRGLAFLDTLEKEAGINKTMKRRAVSDAREWRKFWSYEEEMGETVGIP